MKKVDNCTWYSEEDFVRNLEKNILNKNVYFYPRTDLNLEELFTINSNSLNIDTKELKEANTYTVNEIMYVMHEVPIKVILIQYNRNLQIYDDKFYLSCKNHKYKSNDYMEVDVEERRFHCLECGKDISLLFYIFENEYIKNNLMGIYELIDTLIDTLNIKKIKLRENYVINEELKNRLLNSMNAETISFIDDEELVQAPVLKKVK